MHRQSEVPFGPVCMVHGGDLSEPNGGTNRIVHFASGLADDGIEVTLVVPEPEGVLPEDLTSVEVVTVSRPVISSKALLAAKLVLRAKSVTERRGAVLQIEHSTLAGVASLLGCSGYMLDMHDLVFPSPRFGSVPVVSAAVRAIVRVVEGRGVKRAAHTIVVSAPMVDVLADEWEIPRANVSVIPNGYRPTEVEPYVGVSTVDGRVGFIGTLHPKLDYEKFVAIAAREEVDSVVIIGDGMVREQLREAVEAAGVADTVTLTGRLPASEAYELLASSQVFVYPIKPDEHTRMLTSVKIFDYAALERPMVLDDVSDSRIWQRFKDDDAALFADPTDPDDFVDQVCTLLGDESGRTEVARNASAVVSDYTWQNQVELLRDVYMKTRIDRGTQNES